MPVWSLNRLNRAALALLAVASLAGLSLTASAQQDTPRKPPAQSQKPPVKPAQPPVAGLAAVAAKARRLA